MVEVDWSDRGEVNDVHMAIVNYLDEQNYKFEDYELKNEMVHVIDENGEYIAVIDLADILK